MRLKLIILSLLLTIQTMAQQMLVRLAEIEVYPQYLAEYLAFAQEVDCKSMEMESGVICLYPMQSKEDSTQIRILEIYRDQAAYEAHLQTAHFLRYKQGTIHMVKSLKLSTMQPLDEQGMQAIFKKYCIPASNLTSVKAIDVHSHIIPADYIDNLQQDGRTLDEGFPLPTWDVDAQLRWMDEAGIETSVLTLAAPNPTPEGFHQANEKAAHVCREHPGRFKFCAALPLPDVDAAIREAIYALDTLKADGIKLATNADGQYLGMKELDTLFSVLNERRAVIILHPHRPNPVNRDVMAQTPLAMQEYLSETTRAVTNMISRNVLARYNSVKVVVPHCGAYLPLAIPRMKSLTPVMQANNMVGDIEWEANQRCLYYDLAGAHSPETIRMMLTITTPDHLLYGSDYPYVAPGVLTQSISRLRQYLSEEADLQPYRQMILRDNAMQLFP